MMTLLFLGVVVGVLFLMFDAVEDDDDFDGGFYA